MLSFRRKRKKALPDARLPTHTDKAIGVILTTVEREVNRTLNEEGQPFARVTDRDVFAGRLQSDSFYDAQTEKLPAPDVPEMARPLARPPSSISPFVISRITVRPKKVPPPIITPAQPPPRPSPKPRRVTSRTWSLALFVIGCCGAFTLTMLALQPRRQSAPAHAPPPAVSVMPSIADAAAPATSAR